jgi:CDP-2,3-bis-(O-geranylgeranyl)-sn-glycerol synthase
MWADMTVSIESIHNVALVQLLILLLFANGSPVIAKLLLADLYSWPVDGDARFVDGRPLFGHSKTIRGILVSLVTTGFGALLIGLQFQLGLSVAAAAMAGDLLSSFVKRRLGLTPSSRAIGLDQIPEALFPLLACRSALALTAVDIVVGCAIFFVGEILLSRLLFRLRVRDRPY